MARRIRTFPLPILTMLAVGWALSCGSSGAQTVRHNFWVTNGDVYAVAVSGNTLYLGGEFTRVGPSTGGGVPFDLTGGTPLNSFPKVAGEVHAVAPDGSGGWYIGGSFSAVGEYPRSNIAHILSDYTVSPWNPAVDGWVVYALAVEGATVYVGGYFTSISGQLRNNIAALDAASGLASPWNPNSVGGIAGGGVLALAVSGSTVYVGGGFTNIGGQLRNNIAALDASSGLATAWNPSSTGYIVAALALSGSTVYVGGEFSSIGGQLRNNIAALDAVSGLATVWNPDASNGVLALTVSGSTVYAGGHFTSIGGQTRNHLAALDASSGLATAWNPSADGGVAALAVHGTTVYAGGSFHNIGGEVRNNLGAVNVLSGLATAWDPSVNNTVYSIAASGTTLYVGGFPMIIGGVARNSIAALDVPTGTASTWNPSPSGGFGVNSLAVSGTTVYVSGRFTQIGGEARNNIAALDAATGLATPWDPGAAGSFPSSLTLAVSGSTVYAAGFFTSIGGQLRSNIAALDAASGLVTAWNPSPDGMVSAITVNGSTVYAGGHFMTIGGQVRCGLAAIDANSGLVTAWDPNGNSCITRTIRSLVVSGSTVYVGGRFPTLGGQTRNHVAALDLSSGLATAWNPNSSGEVFALAADQGTVYVGGTFGSIGGQSRKNIAAVEASSGLASSWNYDAQDLVRTIAVGGTAVFAGGSFSYLGLQPQGNLAAIGEVPTAVDAVLEDIGYTDESVVVSWLLHGGPSLIGALQRSQNGTDWTDLTERGLMYGPRFEFVDHTVSPGNRYGYRLSLQDQANSWFTAVSWIVVPPSEAAPAHLSLRTPFPNPSGAGVTFRLGQPIEGRVHLRVFDVRGREIASVLGESRPAGWSEATWGGLTRARLGAPSGVYFAVLEANGEVVRHKFVLAR